MMNFSIIALCQQVCEYQSIHLLGVSSQVVEFFNMFHIVLNVQLNYNTHFHTMRAFPQLKSGQFSSKGEICN